jgi:glycosyltransferase involved in cell wall biosynthesis
LSSILFTVTTDLSYDQRMIRICTSLANAGYEVTLVGRQKKESIPLKDQPYQQKRLFCFFEKGKLFYIEYNLRLFYYLLIKKMDGICAIDLDTILPCYLVSKIKKITRIYDAHELFCEMKEIVTRPNIYKIWKWIERKTVPNFKYGYTVNQLIADEFTKMYGRHFEVIRSIALYNESQQKVEKERFILYQGAVNEGRSFETLIPAMQWVDAPLIICGDGNFMQPTKKMVQELQLQDKVIFKGLLAPAALKSITNKAYIGITLFEKEALSNYYSLANRFFDYIHSGVPQLCVNYPVYKEINNCWPIAVLLDELDASSIATAINELLMNDQHWNQLHENCSIAAKDLNWQKEEEKLIAYYKRIFG